MSSIIPDAEYCKNITEKMRNNGFGDHRAIKLGAVSVDALILNGIDLHFKSEANEA